MTGWNSVVYGLTTGVFTSLTVASMNTLATQQPDQTWYYRLAAWCWMRRITPSVTVELAPLP